MQVYTTKILLVEDEITQRRLILAQLTREGYEVIEASNGREGLQAILDDPEIRLVVTDLSMPEMDGFELIKHIRKSESHYTYIIVLTAQEQKDSVIRALGLGADDYLQKPVLKDELSLRIAGGRRMIRLEGQDELTLAMVKLAGTRSGETGAHLDRVSAYSLILAKELARSQPQLGLTLAIAQDISKVSPLHDIGKVAIPDSILHKPGKLTKEEFEIMKTHAQAGGEILQEIYQNNRSVFLHLGYEVANYHHEKWSGQGYPKGLKGEEIPLSARIVALADVFDALTAERCYKDAFSYDKAKMIVQQESGRHFDPMVVDAYLTHEEEWVGILNSYQDK